MPATAPDFAAAILEMLVPSVTAAAGHVHHAGIVPQFRESAADAGALESRHRLFAGRTARKVRWPFTTLSAYAAAVMRANPALGEVFVTVAIAGLYQAAACRGSAFVPLDPTCPPWPRRYGGWSRRGPSRRPGRSR